MLTHFQVLLTNLLHFLTRLRHQTITNKQLYSILVLITDITDWVYFGYLGYFLSLA